MAHSSVSTGIAATPYCASGATEVRTDGSQFPANRRKTRLQLCQALVVHDDRRVFGHVTDMAQGQLEFAA